MSVEVTSNLGPPPGLKLRCYTCFSLDRNLKPLALEERFLVAMLCPEMFSHAKHNAQYLICWECEFMIVKIRRFQAKLGKAHRRIKMNIQGVKTGVKGLSSLKITRVESINITPPPPEMIPTNQNQPSPNPPAMLKVEQITIKIESEDREKYLSGDHSELIQATKIQQESCDESTDTASEIDMNDDPLKTPKQKKVKVQMKYEKTDMPFQNTVNEAIIPINVISRPQNMPKENLTPRGYKESVKVTRGVSNSGMGKDSDLGLVKREGRSETNVVKHKGRSVPNPVKGKGIVTTPKHEEVPLKPPTGPADLGMCGFEEYDEVKCLILNKDELDKFRDAQRLRQGYKGCAYKCDTCIEKFNTQKTMDEHKKKHVLARGSHICEVCEQRFYDRSVRDDHYKLHFVVYQCLKCPYQSNDQLKISEHIRRNHEVSVFECKKCSIFFKTFKEKRRHRVSVHAKRQPCEECNKTFTNRSQLTTHMAIHQRETTECPTCKKKVRNNYLETHMKSHDDTTEEGAYCVECEKTFKSLKNYQSHLKTSLKHNTVEKVRIKCDHCEKYFSAAGLKHHQEEIRGIKYTCDICKKDSKNKIILQRHIRFVHKGQKPQPKPRICEYCGKSFTLKKCLIQHINSHLGNRTLVCKDCGATFVYSGALYTHRRLVHKVKRKYEEKMSMTTSC